MNSKLQFITVISTIYFVTFISASNDTQSDFPVQANEIHISNVTTITEDSVKSVNISNHSSDVPNKYILNKSELKNIENLLKKRRQDSARR